MLHEIPAQFLRINKITQNFRSAFPMVLLEMLFFSFLFSSRKCNKLEEKQIFFSLFFFPFPSPVGGTESVYGSVSRY